MEAQGLSPISVAVALGLTAIAILAATFLMVEQRAAVIIQRWGKFVREAGPGLQVKIPFVERVIGRVNQQPARTHPLKNNARL